MLMTHKYVWDFIQGTLILVFLNWMICLEADQVGRTTLSSIMTKTKFILMGENGIRDSLKLPLPILPLHITE